MRRAGALVAVAAAVATIPASAGASSQLLPDLRPLRPSQLELVNHPKSGREVLRFATTVANKGAGPLEVGADPATTDCNGDGIATDHLAYQRVYLDDTSDGVFERGQDTSYTDYPAGCRYFDPQHDHWHLADFERYELLPLGSDTPVAEASKVSFCLLDSLNPFPELPGAPASPYYGTNCGELTVNGISVGWADIYAASLPGQRLDVTGLPAGDYCLRITADPDNHLVESNEANNVRGLKLMLDQVAGTVASHGPCA